MAGETLLVISGDGLPPYAVRGITQTLEPIQAAANIRRTVNGTAVNLSASQFQKYRSTISCTDFQPPAFDNVWPGDVLTIDCVKELAYLDGSPSGPQRDVVPGSERTESGYVFYRPRLTMMMISKSEEADEYSAENPWSAEFEEV